MANNTIFSARPERKVLSAAIFAIATSAPMFAQAAMLEEVVVTAQKRTQSLQDVPISVSVTSGETLDKFAIGDLGELSASIPNVTIGQNATQDSITIRGIGSGANHGFEQSVGTFIDGVYFGRGRSSRSPFLDIERLEVLKGPQGVLFGKNTIAGALNITTRKPTDEFEASIEGDYFDGNDSYGVTGVVSGPLTDNIAGRLVVKYRDIGGYIDNRATGDDDPETEETVARGSLAWDVSDRFDIALKAEVSSYDVDGRQLQMLEGGPFRELFESVDPHYEQKLDDKRSTDNPVFGRDFDNTDAENFTATLNYDFDSVRLVSISAYTHYDYNNNIPASWVANLDTAAKRYDEDHSQFSQEFRLESSLEGSLEYILGVFYQTEEVDHTQHFDFDTAQAIADGFPLPPFVGRETFDLEQDTDSYAAFGQVTWHFTERLSTNLGLRYTRDEKDLDFSRMTTGALPFPTYDLKDSRDDSDVTPSINVQYDWGEDTMVYASFSQGFKSGGFDFESGTPFEEETVDAWEAGIKSRLADGAVELNASVFHSEFSDLQVAAWNGVAFETGNAAEATTEGLEIDGRWQISDSWMLSGALAYLNAEYDDFPGATCTAQQQNDHAASGAAGSCTQDLSGEDLQFSPEWSGTVSLEYFREIGSGLELTAMLGADYSDAYFTALDLDPHSEQDSFTKVHARIQIAGESGWSVALVGKNLTDEETTMWVNDVPFFRGAHFASLDGTRNIGIQARYEF
jgi:outer membrane receptor protein involved in Fe transport